MLTPADWTILRKLNAFFTIFEKPTIKLQAIKYPTLNMAIPLYLKMMKKLREMRTAGGLSSIIADACTAALKKLDKVLHHRD